jgi:hypothetical protein
MFDFKEKIKTKKLFGKIAKNQKVQILQTRSSEEKA